MITSLLYKSRLATASMAVCFAVLAIFISDPLPSQEVTPCMFDDGSREWNCVEQPHRFAGNCEGIDCYTSMEVCCENQM